MYSNEIWIGWDDRRGPMRRRLKPESLGLVVTLFLLSACGLTLRHAPPEEIARMTTKTQIPGQPAVELRAPLLRVEHWRVSLGGQDTQSFRLVGRIETGSRSPLRNWLTVETEYGGKPAGYRAARFPDGSLRPLSDVHHTVLRCQEFNALQSACLYRDRMMIDLTGDEIDRYAKTGLTVRLVGKSGDLEKIQVPSNYLQGYLLSLSVWPVQ